MPIRAVLLIVPSFLLLGCISGDGPYRLSAPRNLLTGWEAINSDGSVNAVVEIPAGTNAKWETAKTGDAVEWELVDGTPRIVSYLAYPGNYGIVPSTLLPRELGGDGDPLDVIVLGPAMPRGDVLPVRIIAVLRLLDDGEQDDKLVGVRMEGPLSNVRNLDELEKGFPGVTTILETWFTSYKGPGRTESRGFEDAAAAVEIVEAAAAAFQGKRRSAGSELGPEPEPARPAQPEGP